ncbi:TrmH family RNA methyltransferase [Kineococcus indalonis]|uniref:TrmH family RNA methyltransferase n=1 Tax=Kineococcus indalonis TaxID=2696566 RepID=UPI002B1BDECD|nr:RNA methyltransferase [Kineococcus indalonis]NAZ86043.1 RNA methyltransferase [Kineococcus indalonis]
MRSLTGRPARSRHGRFLAEGPQAVREAVAAHVAARTPGRGGRGAAVVLELYATDEAARRYPGIVADAVQHGVRTWTVTEEVLAAMTDTVTPQGLVAVCPTATADLEDVLARRPRLVAVLDRVRDPGNAGTVLRAADAAGADAVVLTAGSVDVFNPKCVRSTAGSLFHLPVVVGVPLEHAVTALQRAGCAVLAADGTGALDLDDLADAAATGAAAGGTATGARVDLAAPTAWLFGNEAAGLDDAGRAAADAVVRVPLHGRAESLNLATAAVVCLYASARAQRRAR